MTQNSGLPVAVIGAGPVGLAAAAHLIGRGVSVRVYETGSCVGANVREWGHVRLFSPWQYNIDPAARALLERQGWQSPTSDAYPTGHELVDGYLAPLAAVAEIAAVVQTDARVVAIGRLGIDKVVTKGREGRPFALSLVSKDGSTRREFASHVIDASGTWTTPNPLGAGGLPASGEDLLGAGIAHGIPDGTAAIARPMRDEQRLWSAPATRRQTCCWTSIVSQTTTRRREWCGPRGAPT